VRATRQLIQCWPTQSPQVRTNPPVPGFVFIISIVLAALQHATGSPLHHSQLTGHEPNSAIRAASAQPTKDGYVFVLFLVAMTAIQSLSYHSLAHDIDVLLLSTSNKCSTFMERTIVEFNAALYSMRDQ
jgi:hypothetical protein